MVGLHVLPSNMRCDESELLSYLNLLQQRLVMVRQRELRLHFVGDSSLREVIEKAAKT